MEPSCWTDVVFISRRSTLGISSSGNHPCVFLGVVGLPFAWLTQRTKSIALLGNMYA